MKLLTKYPVHSEKNISVDTELILSFDENPILGKTGCIKIFDYNTDELIDILDLSVPAGPTVAQRNSNANYLSTPYIYTDSLITNKNTIAGTPSANYKKDDSGFQLTIIGGFSDGFHFHPFIVRNQSLIIHPHHNLLEYNHTYYIIMDKEIVQGFKGIKDKNDWVFTTKKEIVAKNRKLIVSKSTDGDFRTLQGAIDFIPNHLNKNTRYRIEVKNGDYEEIIYFRNKDYITIIGESKENVLIHYANNEIFNPHPSLIKTNEKIGTFPSRRAAFAIDHCTHITLKNLTLKNDAHGQAEGLLVNGKSNYFENIHVIGSGDALQTNGSAYYKNCIIDGEGDTILGRGPAFFENTIINSYNAFMWIRNTKENHGNVFVNCTFNGKNDQSVIARLPNNHGIQYPDAECVLINCELNNIPDIGFDPIDEDALSAKFYEYNSHNSVGKLVDVTHRHKCVKQLTLTKDRALILKYSNYAYVLGEDFDINLS